VIADGKLLLLADTGTLILARADPACYQELARTQLFEGEICWTPPMLWNGRLFVRSPSRAVCVLVGNANRPLPTMNAVAPTTPALRFDADRLLARERDFPNDAPTWQEMTLWFAACIVLVFGGAGLTALLCVLTAKHLLKRKLAGTFVFLPSALVLGALGPNVFSSWADVILFTWPACLYVAFHAAVLACGWAQSIDPPRRAASWLARLAVLVFLAIGYAYYEACKIVGMFVAWSFLVGFPFAFPFTVLAVRATLKDARVLAALWTLAAFTVFFWSAQVLLMWKAG
jgi:hypothetical protein